MAALYHQIRGEMLCKKTGFHYTGPPEELEGCQWPMPTVRYAAYRLTLTIHMIMWLALSFYAFSSSDEMTFTTPTKWFLGKWNMLLLLGYTIWSLAIQVNTLVRDFYKKRSFMPIDFDPSPQKEEPQRQSTIEPPTPIDVPFKHKVGWFLYNISFTMSISTTVIFWTIQYEGEDFNYLHLFYGLNIVVVLLDSFMIPYPIYFLHIWHTYFLGLVLTIGTVLYMAVMDPNNVWVYTGDGGLMAMNVSFIGLFVIPGCQVLSVMTYHIRAKVFAHTLLSKKLNPKDSWDAMPKRLCCCCCRNKCDCYDCFLV